MDLYEWKQKYTQKPSPQYTHFDRRVSLKNCFGYITSPDKVSHHGFYPFIHYTLRNRKVKNGQKCSPKVRDIYYAAHLDGWIFRYYAYLINEAYNTRVKADGLDTVSVAYRTNLGKSNIQFAKEAFDHIRGTGSCYVVVGDFTSFFDHLDHAYLKERLCDLLSVSRLPDDYYAVLKNVTRFSYVELQDLLRLNGFEYTFKDRRQFNSRSRERALPPEQLRKNRTLIHPNPGKGFGVPQGSPISAVLANVYMLEGDKKLQEYVSALGGFYMRYSDDFILVLPCEPAEFAAHYASIREILSSIPNLTLEASKTKAFHYENSSVKNCTNQFILNDPNGPGGKDLIEFLGFSFDGAAVHIRDKTISKYYNRMYRKTRAIVKCDGVTKNGNRISCKNLYARYSYKGSLTHLKKISRKTGVPLEQDQKHGNFLDYVARAGAEFRGDPIDAGTKRHMQKIRKKLDAIK